MKKKRVLIIALVLLAVMIIVSLAAVAKYIYDAISYVEDQAAAEQENGSAESNVSIPFGMTNTIPQGEVTEFRMVQLELRFFTDDSGRASNGIRFKAYMPSWMKHNFDNDSTARLKTFIAPAFYFDELIAANPDLAGFEGIDWVQVFEADGRKFIDMASDGFYVEYYNGVTYNGVRGSISNILFENLTLDFVGLSYVESYEGNVVKREFAKLPKGQTYQEYAISMAYLACDALNKDAIDSSLYTDEERDVLKYVRRYMEPSYYGVDPEDPDAYDCIHYPFFNKSDYVITVGESCKLDFDLSYPFDLPALWMSDDPAVAAVDAEGQVIGVNPGTAIVTVYVAGYEFTASVTVTK